MFSLLCITLNSPITTILPTFEALLHNGRGQDSLPAARKTIEPDDRFQLSAPLTKWLAFNKPYAYFRLPFLEGVVRGGIWGREIDEFAPTYYLPSPQKA
jgi:hypothetical protein